MKFKDYGIIEWFDTSKGFGVARTSYNGSVFIHNFNMCNYSFPSKNISEKFILIGEIKEKKKIPFKNMVELRKYINQQDRLEGYDVTIWEKDNESFYEIIYQYWLSKLPLKYDKDIKWLISRCSLSLLEKIINSNKDYWNNSEEFLKNLYNNSLYENQKHKNYVGEYFLYIWEKSENKKYDNSLARAVNLGESYILEKALEINYNWIKDSDFINRFNDEKYDKKTFSMSTVKVYRFDKSTIFNFLLDKISSKTNEEYDDDIKWIIANGDSSIFLKILEFKFLYSNRQFVLDVRKLKKQYSSEDFAVFLYNLWIEKGRMSFNNDIKWILQKGPENLIDRIIKINYSNWVKDIKFINTIRTMIYSYPRMKVKYEAVFEKDKISVFDEFIYNIWNLQQNKQFDDNFKWLIINGKIDTLKNIINQNKKKLLINDEFIDFILEIRLFEEPEFKENILIEACMLDTSYKYNKIVKWLFENCSVDKIKFLLNLKFGYNANIVEKIHSAFFPLYNIKYFKEKADLSDWSYYFKETYVEERESESNKKFKNLFLNEIEKSENKLTQKRYTRKETHAATDLANFVFCPASYVINQKYNIDIQEQENVFVGNKEHEKQRLLRLSLYDRVISEEEKQRLISLHGRLMFDVDNYKMSFKKDNEFFYKIKNSKCISQGHKDTDKVIYYSKTKKLSGIPDYIFQDNNGYFAVEEKYTFKKYEELTELYDSHKVQALAYLYGLDEFQFKEVYVVYWYIKKTETNDNYYVYNYRLFKLIKSKENKEIIINAFNNVESIQKRIPYSFSPNRINYNKCIRCNYFPFCEYKKGNNSYIELPPLSNDIIN